VTRRRRNASRLPSHGDAVAIARTSPAYAPAAPAPPAAPPAAAPPELDPAARRARAAALEAELDALVEGFEG
jgi:hypothetical protein